MPQSSTDHKVKRVAFVLELKDCHEFFFYPILLRLYTEALCLCSELHSQQPMHTDSPNQGVGNVSSPRSLRNGKKHLDFQIINVLDVAAVEFKKVMMTLRRTLLGCCLCI